MKKIAVAIGVLLVFTVLAGQAAAERGGRGKGGSNGGGNQTVAASAISLNQTDPHFGGVVTFTANYPKIIRDAFIRVNCYQGGDVVYGEGGRADSEFKLGGDSSRWVANGGGAADCEAGLYHFEGDVQTWLAWTTFEAAG